MKPNFKLQLTWGELKRRSMEWDKGHCSYAGKLFGLPFYLLIEKEGKQQTNQVIVPACYLPKAREVDKLYITVEEYVLNMLQNL